MSQSEVNSSCQQVSSKPYAVIELKVRGKNYVTPCVTMWLKGIEVKWNRQGDKETYFAKSCSWPSDETNLSVLLLNRVKPKADWNTLTSIRIFSFCNSLSKANNIADKASMTSDISDCDQSLLPKRKRQSTDFYQAGDNSSDEETPVPLKRIKISSNALVSSDEDDGDDTPLSALGTRIITSRPANAVDPLLSTPSTSDSAVARTVLKGLNNNRQDISSTPSTPSTSDGAAARMLLAGFNSIRQDMSSTPSTQSTSDGKTVLAGFNNFRQDLSNLMKIVFKIYVAVCNPQETPDNEASVPLLPISSQEKFLEFNEYCKNENQKLSTVKFLSEWAGNTIRTSVFTAVKLHCMKAHPTITFNLIEFNTACSDWLKDAKKRMKNELVRRRKEEERTRLNQDDDDDDAEMLGS
ncbi:Twin horsetail protein 2 [Frankliniella fusca]|uniref:Twin horsetail protein 2 n=1 Tax=Frankliniella fusca TaxID=407009 RepID=A0AAE1GVC0_9NEOP|nr:Twin horsetail protein 2 [Frankliniella fusca]